MKKRTFALAMALVLALSLLPGTALAADYDLTVAGVAVTDENAADVLEDGTVSYDAETNTLTLNNANIDYAADSAILYNLNYSGANDFTIEFTGNNSVSSSGEYETISVYADLVIRGDGTLNISGTYSGCVYADNVSVTSGTYTFAPAEDWWDIFAAETLNISGENTVITSETVSAFGGEGDIVISDGAKFNSANRLYSKYGDIEISDSSFEALNSIDASGDVTITGSTINMQNSTYELPIYGENITISGGEVTVSTDTDGKAIPIFAENDITIKDGAKVTAENYSGERSMAAIYSGNEIVIDGAQVSADATGENSTGIHAVGQINIKNGSIVSAHGTRLGLGSNHKYESGDDPYSAPIVVENSWLESSGSLSTHLIVQSVFFKGSEGGVYNDATIPDGAEIPEGATLTVPEGSTLTVPEGAELVNKGTIVNNGTIVNDGAIDNRDGEITGGGAVTGDGEVLRRSSSAPRYSVTVEDVEGGTVTATPDNAPKGLTVTVKVKPDEGYALDTLIVTDAGGNEISLYERSETEYSFAMPGSAVTVEAVFEGGEVEMPVEEGLPFTDVRETDWHYDAVKYVYENGLMNGVADDEFDPNATLTRSMMVTLLWRLEGEPVVNYLMPFDDVDEGGWYGEAVRWAVSEGIVNGVSESAFAPDAAITREQLAAILYRYAQYKGMEAVDLKENLTGFDDADSISEYAVSAMNWAVGAQLMRGVTDSELSPQGSATRAQVATMMMRFIESL